MRNETTALIELMGMFLAGSDNPVNGLYWTDLEGWWGLPDSKGSSEGIPGANGTFSRADIYRESRAITLTGHILTHSAQDLALVRYRLETALGLGAGDMTVHTSAYGSWTRHVEIDTLQIDPDHGRTWTKFTVDMIAPDPVRYSAPYTLGPVGLPVREGGLILPEEFPWDFGTSVLPSVPLVNEGAVPIYPIVTVRGAADALVVHGGPRRISFGAFNGELVINNKERRVWLNGGDVTRQLVYRNWQSVPAGVTQDFHFDAVNASSETTMTVEYRIGAW